MPVVFREAGFRFHFFSNEGDPREPVHMHVSKDDADAKLWLYPDVSFAYSHGIDARTRHWIAQLIEMRRSEIEHAWNEHFP